jgi:hypothetical protein
MSSALDLVNPFNFFGNFGENLKSPKDFDSMTVDTYLRLNTRFKSVRDIIQVCIIFFVSKTFNFLK